MTSTGFLIMSVSGLIAYIVPHGRIAYWTDWHFLGLTKTNWADIHILSGLLFLIAGGFHIYLNWKSLINYFVNRTNGGLYLKKEMFVCLVTGILIVASSIMRLPPLSYVLDLNEYVKASWVVSKEYEPPFGHAELLSLKALCNKLRIPLAEAQNELKKHGVKINSETESFATIAANNNMTPAKLFTFIQHLEPRLTPPAKPEAMTPEMVEEQFAGTGIGRKTIKELAAELNLDSNEIIKRLANFKISVAEDDTVKQSADKNGLQPIELLKGILIQGYSPK
jgi:hypothetical protein